MKPHRDARLNTTDFKPSAKSRDSQANSRCYSSCENTRLKRGLYSRNGTKRCSKVSLRKFNPTADSRHSGRLIREAPFYDGGKPHSRAQAHPAYCANSAEHYIPLSAHIRQSNQSDELGQLHPGQHRPNRDINIKVLYQNCSKLESHSFDCILPLGPGSAVFNKSGTAHPAQQEVLGPTDPSNTTPGAFGYGVRYFSLDPTLGYIEVRQHFKSGADKPADADDALKPVIPHTTIDIVKYRKQRLPEP